MNSLKIFNQKINSLKKNLTERKQSSSKLKDSEKITRNKVKMNKKWPKNKIKKTHHKKKLSKIIS